MTIYCSQCGSEKRETNHWWFVWYERGGARYCATPWETDSVLALDESVEKLCGINCLVVAHAKWAHSQLNIGARV